MTKKEVLDAIDCINCYQDDNICYTKRDYLNRNSCKDCAGIYNASATIADFVNLMIDKLDEEDE